MLPEMEWEVRMHDLSWETKGCVDCGTNTVSKVTAKALFGRLVVLSRLFATGIFGVLSPHQTSQNTGRGAIAKCLVGDVLKSFGA